MGNLNTRAVDKHRHAKRAGVIFSIDWVACLRVSPVGMVELFVHGASLTT